MRVLAFDIGIKNLAYCILERSARDSIIAWENINIFNDDSVDKEAPITCSKCTSKPKFYVKRDILFSTEQQTVYYCQRHLTPDRPPIKDMSGTLYTEVPSLVELKELAVKSGAGKPAKQTKDAWIALLEKQYAFPVKAPKKKHVMHAGLEAFHDALLNSEVLCNHLNDHVSFHVMTCNIFVITSYITHTITHNRVTSSRMNSPREGKKKKKFGTLPQDE